MRRIMIFTSVGYAGMDGTYQEVVPENSSEKYLEEICWDTACNHADMYGYSPPSDYDDGEDDEYISDYIEGHYEDYDPAVHGEEYLSEFERLEREY